MAEPTFREGLSRVANSNIPPWAAAILLALCFAFAGFAVRDWTDAIRKMSAQLEKVDQRLAVIEWRTDQVEKRAEWAQQEIFKLWDRRQGRLPVPDGPGRRGDADPVGIVPEKRRMTA